jgi:hypothetical protein
VKIRKNVWPIHWEGSSQSSPTKREREKEDDEGLSILMMPGTVSPPPRPPGAKWPGFLVNRSGLPFDELTWNELWEFAAHLYPEARPTLRKVHLTRFLSNARISLLNYC